MTFKLPEGQTNRVLFHACAVQIPILSLGCLGQQGYWTDLRADISTQFFLDKIQTKHSQTQLHKEESLFLVEGVLVAPLSTAGVSDEVAQEWQMPIGPQMLEDVEGPMLARAAALRDPGTSDQIVMEQHSLTHLPSQPWCKMCVESRGRDSPHREQSKLMQLCLSLTTGTWVTEALSRSRASSWEETPLLEPSTRRLCPTPRRWTCPTLLPQQQSGCEILGINDLSTCRQRRSSLVATGQNGKRMSS